MSWEPILSKIGLEAVKRVLGPLQIKLSQKRSNELLSQAYKEILEDGDLDEAEAKILAAEAIAKKPSSKFLRINDMLKKARAWALLNKKKKKKKKPKRKKKLPPKKDHLKSG